ncbi:hypothetical protein GV828_03955 [Flavobacterium sp. NST-5]|uniref:Uncharacterized protein n=1 Tax=Flavobacterium ichthyis TaxID=2698827 RepID=A0ABW9Z8C5_9FLAO|nr:hypothetical protein [Flavobacterium ichthyis]NBL64355.1 hypothetical protein [Flavobacterium ichthyis]
MKRLSFLLKITCIVLFTACNSDDNSNNNVALDPYISFNVSGFFWSSNSAVIGSSVTDGQHNFTVAGTDETFNGEISSFSAIFSTPEQISIGTYILNDDNDGGVALTKLNNKTYLGGMSSTTFTLTIEEIEGSGSNRRFSGSFAGTLVGPTSGDIVTISNGYFSNFPIEVAD